MSRNSIRPRRARAIDDHRHSERSTWLVCRLLELPVGRQPPRIRRCESREPSKNSTAQCHLPEPGFGPTAPESDWFPSGPSSRIDSDWVRVSCRYANGTLYDQALRSGRDRFPTAVTCGVGRVDLLWRVPPCPAFCISKVPRQPAPSVRRGPSTFRCNLHACRPRGRQETRS
jgi:hypothetical protein